MNVPLLRSVPAPTSIVPSLSSRTPTWPARGRRLGPGQRAAGEDVDLVCRREVVDRWAFCRSSGPARADVEVGAVLHVGVEVVAAGRRPRGSRCRRRAASGVEAGSVVAVRFSVPPEAIVVVPAPEIVELSPQTRVPLTVMSRLALVSVQLVSSSVVARRPRSRRRCSELPAVTAHGAVAGEAAPLVGGCRRRSRSSRRSRR